MNDKLEILGKNIFLSKLERCNWATKRAIVFYFSLNLCIKPIKFRRKRFGTRLFVVARTYLKARAIT